MHDMKAPTVETLNAPDDMAKTDGPRRRTSLLAFFPGLRISRDELRAALAWGILVLLLWTGLFLAIGSPFLPSHGAAWAIAFLWVSALVAGALVDRIGIPAPVGMLLAGVAIQNIHQGSAIAGLKSSWSSKIRGMCLSFIFLRSGLELDLKTANAIRWPALRLLLVPGIVETFFDGGLAVVLFAMPPTFAFALGSILNAVGPALVVQCMAEAQQAGLGTAKRIPSIVVAAAGFDDALAISMYTIFINVAVTGEGNEVWNSLQGPLSIVFGALAGVAAAALCAPTAVWNSTLKRVLATLLLTFTMTFFFNQFGFTSAGPIAALVLGVLVREAWARRLLPPYLMLPGEDGEKMGDVVAGHVAWFWSYVMCPLLFSLTGAIVDFSTMPSATVGRACGIVFAGLGVRMPASFLAMSFSGFSWREKLFFAVAWTPKATVQASLAAQPMDQVKRLIPESSLRYLENAAWAEDCLVTAVMCILLCAPLGAIATKLLGPFLLSKVEEQPDAEAGPVVAAPLVHRSSMRASYKKMETSK